MSGYNYVDRKLDVTSHNKDHTSVGPCEISIARLSRLTSFQSQINAEIRSGVRTKGLILAKRSRKEEV